MDEREQLLGAGCLPAVEVRDVSLLSPDDGHHRWHLLQGPHPTPRPSLEVGVWFSEHLGPAVCLEM